MKDFKGFIFYNDINQKDVIEYLGVSKGYMSLVISGKKKLSEENFRKLIENPFGWDTSMLVDSPDPVLESSAPAMNLSNVEILLREMLAEKEAKIDALNEIIWDLKAENAMLKEQVKYKGAHAEGAAGSFVADAV